MNKGTKKSRGLHTRAWEENISRIAQLLKRGEDFGYLADDFMNVANFEEYRLRGQEEGAETLLESIPVLEEQGEDAMRVVVRGTGGKVEPRVEVPALEAPKDGS